MNHQITGVVLAGGRGTRMGGLDKGLVLLDGRPMIDYALERLRPQVGDILISANRNQERYAKFGHRVVSDTHEGYLGPLAGVAAALDAATTDYIVTIPCDSPLIPDNLVARLWMARERNNVELVVAHDGWRLQPVFMMIRRDLSHDLAAFLTQGDHQVELWIERHRYARARFFGNARAFSNVNDPDDRRRLESQLRDQRLC